MKNQLEIKLGSAAGVLFLGLAVAGCGSSGNTPFGGPATSAPALVSTTAPSIITTAPSAADGTNVEACSDGNCEISLSGPVDIPLTGQGGGMTKLSITKVNLDGIDFATTSSGETGSGNLNHGCTLTFYQSGGGSSCSSSNNQDRPQPKAGVLAIQLASVGNGTAILRLVSG